MLAPYAPVGRAKFFWMSLLTLGIYDVYWMYRHWTRIRARTGEHLSPSWRAFLAPFFAFSLFARVKRDATELAIPVSWNPYALAAAYLLLSVAWLLPTPWLFGSFVAFLPLIPLADATRAINGRAGATEDPNDRYSLGNLLGMIVGGFVLAILVAVSLMGY